MTNRTDEATEYDTVGADADAYERYGEIDLENGSVVVFDAENGAAWIQSDRAVGCGDLR